MERDGRRPEVFPPILLSARSHTSTAVAISILPHNFTLAKEHNTKQQQQQSSSSTITKTTTKTTAATIQTQLNHSMNTSSDPPSPTTFVDPAVLAMIQNAMRLFGDASPSSDDTASTATSSSMVTSTSGNSGTRRQPSSHTPPRQTPTSFRERSR